MLTGLTVEEMYVYYAVATVHAVATSRSIRLFIEIPLKAADRYFELYQVHSLPFFHEEIDNFVMIDEPFSYLAVAEDRQYFTTLTPHMLSKCATDYCNEFAGSISRWNFITLTVQYTTLDYSSQLF
jgi:hypothetical protein